MELRVLEPLTSWLPLTHVQTRRDEPRVGPPAAADLYLGAGRVLLEVVAEAVAELVAADLYGGGRRSGAEGARTPDLCHAMAALSQLIYSPRQQVIGRKV